jgi:hypothetical protein
VLPPSRIEPPLPDEPVVGPVDPEAPPAPLEVVVGDVVDDVPVCPEPVFVVLELVVSDPPLVGPVPVLEVVSDVVLEHVSTLGSHRALPSSVHPRNAAVTTERRTPTKEMRDDKLRTGMCFLSHSCPGRRALATG